MAVSRAAPLLLTFIVLAALAQLHTSQAFGLGSLFGGGGANPLAAALKKLPIPKPEIIEELKAACMVVQECFREGAIKEMPKCLAGKWKPILKDNKCLDKFGEKFPKLQPAIKIAKQLNRFL